MRKNLEAKLGIFLVSGNDFLTVLERQNLTNELPQTHVTMRKVTARFH